MLGDKYQVFTAVDNYTRPDGVFDKWGDAKEARNVAFFSDDKVQAAWVMRSNPATGLRQDKYGQTLRK